MVLAVINVGSWISAHLVLQRQGQRQSLKLNISINQIHAILEERIFRCMMLDYGLPCERAWGLALS